MADLNIVVEKLHSFEDADDLADYFRQYGIQARPQESRACAITAFVEIETGEVGNIMTSTREITLRETMKDSFGYDQEMDVAVIQHTHAMVQFVRNYDTGKYPFLVEDGYEYDPNGIDFEGHYCYCMECRPEDGL